MVLRGLTIDKKSLKDHMEAIGHKEAFDFVRELVSNNVVLTEAVIKQTHALLLIGNRQHRAVYRQVPVRIIDADYEPVQPILIEPSMEKLLREFDASNEHIITKLAKFHIAFERIHPFIGGNGRTGRLLVN